MIMASLSTPNPESHGVRGGQSASTSYEPVTPPPELEDPITRRIVSLGSSNTDVEAPPSQPTPESDPYRLSSKLKSASEIELIGTRPSSIIDEFILTIVDKQQAKARKLRGFYEKQNERIQRMLMPVDEHVQTAKDVQKENHLKIKVAVIGSFAANIMLAFLQMYAAISSLSLSLFTTMADSIFDPMSNLTLIVCNRAVNRVDPRKFPSGKARIETAGNIVFCFLMTAVSFILIVMSARDIASSSETDTRTFHLPSVIAVSVAFSCKLALFLYCWPFRNQYSQIQILWEDHRNDLFINGFGILTSVGGSKLRWWIDPLGAIILSLLISSLWLRTAYKEFQLLIGVAADTETLQLFTYIAMTHDPMIRQIDTVRAYHSGPRLVVEIDLVMDRSVSLQESHDVAEALQFKLESLPDVERAYVHNDYETSHKPEHFLKKEI